MHVRRASTLSALTPEVEAACRSRVVVLTHIMHFSHILRLLYAAGARRLV
jgi:hypothetical protein